MNRTKSLLSWVLQSYEEKLVINKQVNVWSISVMLKAMKKYKMGKGMEPNHQGEGCDLTRSSDHLSRG